MAHSVLQHPLEQQDHDFLSWAESWSGLGVWCTLWDAQGQIISPTPSGAPFWKALWNHSQEFRNEISKGIRQNPERSFSIPLTDLEGLRLHGIRLQTTAGALVPNPILIVGLIVSHAPWDENLARLCSRWQLDEQVLTTWARQHPPLISDQASCVLDLVAQGARNLHLSCHQTHELTQMTDQLGRAYEELNLLYRLGSSMRVTQQPREHFQQLFDELARTTDIVAMTAILYDTEVLNPDNRLILGGEPILDAPQALRMAEALRPLVRKSSNALIINQIRDYPQLDWAQGWLEQLLAVPILRNQNCLGMLVAINQCDRQPFDSTDARLLHSVVDRSAIYLENVLLYGDINKLFISVLHALVASIDAKDPYTCGHSNRVAVVCRRLVERSRADSAMADRIYLSGLLHDIGKIGISEMILCKPGKLTNEEMTEMHRHSEVGAKILSGIKQLDDVLPGVLHHHEWLNGSGYPSGLTQAEIPWMAKVVGLADAYDAMTTGRNYRPALPIQSALAEVRRYAGVQFCPELAEVLIQLVKDGLPEELKYVKKTAAFESVYRRWQAPGQEP